MQHAVEAYGNVMQPLDQSSSSSAHRSGFVERYLHQNMKRRRMEESELWRYLAAPTADADVDILQWWKFHAREYPCLARIARDYLAAPATSVPAERVFSDGADLITKKRGSLSEDTIRACICLKSWLRVLHV